MHTLQCTELHYKPYTLPCKQTKVKAEEQNLKRKAEDRGSFNCNSTVIRIECCDTDTAF